MEKIDYNYDAIYGYNDDYCFGPDFEQINSPHVVSTITKYGINKGGKLTRLCIKIQFNDSLYKEFSTNYPTKFVVAQEQLDGIKIEDNGTKIVFIINTLSESYLTLPLNNTDYYDCWGVLIENGLKAKDNKSFSDVISEFIKTEASSNLTKDEKHIIIDSIEPIQEIERGARIIEDVDLSSISPSSLSHQ